MSYNVTRKPLDWFKDNHENYRSHPPEQVAVLQQSLQRFGVFRNVVARPDGTLLAGHGIIQAAKAEGMTEFPCVVFEGTDSEARALMVADNEQARLSVNNDRKMTDLLKELTDEDNTLLLLTGFNEEMLAGLVLTTRTRDEIPDIEAAQEWVGLPSVDDGPMIPRFNISVWTGSEKDREAAVKKLGGEVIQEGRIIIVHYPQRLSQLKDSKLQDVDDDS